MVGCFVVAWIRGTAVNLETEVPSEALAATLESWSGPVYVISALAGRHTQELAADVMRRLEEMAATEAP